MKLLDRNFNVLCPFTLEELNAYKTQIHVYGDTQPTGDELFWMQYAGPADATGDIGFMRQIEKRYPEFALGVVNYLKGLFPKIPFTTERVILIRTRGNVAAHRDEVRSCCINIGLMNSSSACTLVSNDDDERTMESNHEETVIQDGQAYLLDVSRLHAVEAIENVDRILVSYGFLATYDKILSQYQAQ